MKFLVSILIVMSAGQAAAQELSITMGYGTYEMKDFRLLNREFQLTLGGPFQLEIIDNFPGYVSLGANFTWPVVNRFALGAEVCLTSTGSRLSYRDFSGFMRIDQEIHGASWSVLPTFTLFEAGNMELTAQSNIGITVSRYSIRNQLSAGSIAEFDEIDFSSVNTFLQPELRVTRYVGTGKHRAGIGLRVGYYFTISSGKLYYQDDDYYFVLGGDPAYADWSGIRANLSLSWRFFR